METWKSRSRALHGVSEGGALLGIEPRFDRQRAPTVLAPVAAEGWFGAESCPKAFFLTLAT